ncbi:hypothetical protein Z945_3019 [Sulfitobacter noctilucae]|nr:hypothetical protein Z945_3019 [Sulfitobacter noctilucae]
MLSRVGQNPVHRRTPPNTGPPLIKRYPGRTAIFQRVKVVDSQAQCHWPRACAKLTGSSSDINPSNP